MNAKNKRATLTGNSLAINQKIYEKTSTFFAEK